MEYVCFRPGGSGSCETSVMRLREYMGVRLRGGQFVAAATRADRRSVTHVSVKVRTATFFTRTRGGKLTGPTTDGDVVAAKAREVLGRFDIGRPIRLVGVRVELDAGDAAVGAAELAPPTSGKDLGDP